MDPEAKRQCFGNSRIVRALGLFPEIFDADRVALRLGHGVCWALLAASMLIGVADGPPRLRAGLAWAALAAYAAFVVALLAG